MQIKRKISAVLTLTSLFAMAFNAFVVLSCDCATCHTHFAPSCHCEDCSLFEGDASISQNCDCAHPHENASETGITIENERVLKQMRIIVAALPRALAELVNMTAQLAQEASRPPLSVPLNDFRLVEFGGLRAPPVFA